MTTEQKISGDTDTALFSPPPADRQIGAFFVAQGLCDATAITHALEQQRNAGGRLGEILQALVGIRALDYYRAQTKYYGLPFVNLILRKPDATLQHASERVLYFCCLDFLVFCVFV